MPKKTSIKTSTDTDNIHFENALSELENIISKMESGQLSLQDSLANFESGIALSKKCQEALKDAEQKVQILVEKSSLSGDESETFQTKPFAVMEE